MPTGKRTDRAPKSPRAAASKMMAMAIDDMSPENWLSLRLRKGAKATWLSSKSQQARNDRRQREGKPDGQSGIFDQPQGDQAPEGEDGGVGEVQHIQDAEDERIAHREQPVHAAYEEAVDQLLEK